jgi:hypothetical protein
MAEEILNNKVSRAFAEDGPDPEAPIPTDGSELVVTDEEVEDLFDFGRNEIEAPVPEEEDLAEAEPQEDEEEEAAAPPPAAKRAPAKPPRLAMPPWIWGAVAALVVLNLGIGALFMLRGPKETKKTLADPKQIAAAPTATPTVIPTVTPTVTPAVMPTVMPTVAQTTSPAAATPNHIAEAPAANPTNTEIPIRTVPAPRPISVSNAANFSPAEQPRLAAAEALYAKARYAEARKKFFEVLLAPSALFDGQDAALARLRIAQCLAREGAPPSAPVRTRTERVGAQPEDAKK